MTATEKRMIRRHLLPHATFGDDPSGWCGCAGCDPSDDCGCASCAEVDICDMCEHPVHGPDDCEETLGYDHLNGFHECNCLGSLADQLAQAWDEGHAISGCVYFPDCHTRGDHTNPYRAPDGAA